MCDISESECSSTEADTDFIHSTVSSKPRSHDNTHKEAKCKMEIGGKEIVFSD